MKKTPQTFKFEGGKKFLSHHYSELQSSNQLSDLQIKQIFHPYTQQLGRIKSQDGHYTLLPLFCQFVRGNALQFRHWGFEKFSAWVEIGAHVFQYSFQNHFNQKQSFQYFSQIVIRHSLFRPPHSVNIFTYEQAKQIMEYWMATFVRFYQQYRQCFEAQLNQIIQTVVPRFAPQEQPIQTKKQISREDFAAKFGNIIDINEAPKKAA